VLWKAVLTVNGSSFGRLERNFAFLSTVRAGGFRHFTGAAKVPGTAEISVSSVIFHWMSHAVRNAACTYLTGLYIMQMHRSPTVSPTRRSRDHERVLVARVPMNSGREVAENHAYAGEGARSMRGGLEVTRERPVGWRSVSLPQTAILHRYCARGIPSPGSRQETSLKFHPVPDTAYMGQSPCAARTFERGDDLDQRPSARMTQ